MFHLERLLAPVLVPSGDDDVHKKRVDSEGEQIKNKRVIEWVSAGWLHCRARMCTNARSSSTRYAENVMNIYGRLIIPSFDYMAPWFNKIKLWTLFSPRRLDFRCIREDHFKVGRLTIQKNSLPLLASVCGVDKRFLGKHSGFDKKLCDCETVVFPNDWTLCVRLLVGWLACLRLFLSSTTLFITIIIISGATNSMIDCIDVLKSLNSHSQCLLGARTHTHTVTRTRVTKPRERANKPNQNRANCLSNIIII